MLIETTKIFVQSLSLLVQFFKDSSNKYPVKLIICRIQILQLCTYMTWCTASRSQVHRIRVLFSWLIYFLIIISLYSTTLYYNVKWRHSLDVASWQTCHGWNIFAIRIRKSTKYSCVIICIIASRQKKIVPFI